MPRLIVRIAVLLLVGLAVSVASRGGFSTTQWFTHFAAYKLAFYAACGLLALFLMRVRSGRQRQRLGGTGRPSLGSGRSDLDLPVPSRAPEPIDRKEP